MSGTKRFEKFQSAKKGEGFKYNPETGEVSPAGRPDDVSLRRLGSNLILVDRHGVA